MKNGFLRSCASALVALVAAMGLSACGGGNSDNPPAAETGSVAGRVLASADSAPVAGATVSIGSSTTQTAADGSFTLADVPASDRAVVRVHAAGYVDGLVNSAVVKNATRQTVARLVREAPPVTFDAAQTGVVTAAGSSARVDLPAAALVNAATGAAATGSVRASVTPIDPAADPQTMPGDYTVADGSRIESFGAIKVQLQDAAGNKLQLKAGSQATIRIPLASRSGTPPATIPLYYFDETTGRWVQDGQATLKGSAPNAYYEGQVSHFTYWNADQPQDTIYVNGCVATASGSRVQGALVTARGIDYSGSSYDNSDDQGRFRVAIRKNGKAALWAELGTSSNAVVVGPSGTDITLTDCLVLDATAAAPSIVVPPASQSVAEGASVYFSVVANGSRPLRYQWQRNGVDIPGAVYDTLPFYVTSSADAGSYRVIVSNDQGSTTSASATLTISGTVLAAPQIIAQPMDISAAAGDTATFAVFASGTPTPTYQWQRNGTPIAGATSANFTTPTLTAADTGATYSVVITNSQGTVTSRAATLTVTTDGTLAQKMQLMRLLALSFDFYQAASMPMQVVDQDAAAFISPSAACTSGSISATFNGGALPAPGTALPPSGTLAATANACVADEMLYTGSSSVAYSFSSLDPANGTATATVNNVRVREPSTGTAQEDFTANGQATATIASSVANGQTTTNVTLALASDATLRSELSGLSASFASGNVGVRTVTTGTNTMPLSSRVTYNDLRFAVTGVNYAANGFYELDYTAAGVFSGGSGQVLLTSGGSTVGRIYADATGLFIEVNGTVQPFKAPSRPLAH